MCLPIGSALQIDKSQSEVGPEGTGLDTSRGHRFGNDYIFLCFVARL